MKRFILILLIQVSVKIKAQSCDSLKNEGMNFSAAINTLEQLVETNCDNTKLSLAYELLVGYRIERDSMRAMKLLNECQEDDTDCKYEPFKVYYENEPEIAY